MFLSKKNAIYLNKPKGDSNKPKRILGDWQDTPDKPQTYDYLPKKDTRQVQVPNLLEGQIVDVSHQNSKPPTQKFYFDWKELSERNDIDCEKKLIEEIVKPGGVRIKPTDGMLGDFAKEAKGMDVPIIGSLLISVLEVSNPYGFQGRDQFQVKAKALHTIQFLVKKQESYCSYFRAHSDKILNAPDPEFEQNLNYYKKILNSILTAIGVSVTQPGPKDQKIVYVDPGYNDDPKIENREGKKGLLAMNGMNVAKGAKQQKKKTIIGPGQAAKQHTQTPKDVSDILGINLLGDMQPKEMNLLEEIAPQGELKSQKVEISFDQLLGNIKTNPNIVFRT